MTQHMNVCWRVVMQGYRVSGWVEREGESTPVSQLTSNWPESLTFHCLSYDLPLPFLDLPLPFPDLTEHCCLLLPRPCPLTMAPSSSRADGWKQSNGTLVAVDPDDCTNFDGKVDCRISLSARYLTSMYYVLNSLEHGEHCLSLLLPRVLPFVASHHAFRRGPSFKLSQTVPSVAVCLPIRVHHRRARIRCVRRAGS